LVVDDEAPARNEVAWLLDQDERVGRVLTASSGTSALAALEREHVDVVFSDISMPGLDGMQLARVIRRFSERPQVVFVTAHDTHAVDAFDLDAVDYLMKPVRPERIGEAVRRCLAATDRDDEPEATPEDDETIPVELGGVTRFVRRSEIRWV
ncbi:response regulator, partial [Caldibacillus thermoamylovorans]|nr:response regulator [Caldibacillus thermoamylovorans]